MQAEQSLELGHGYDDGRGRREANGHRDRYKVDQHACEKTTRDSICFYFFYEKRVSKPTGIGDDTQILDTFTKKKKKNTNNSLPPYRFVCLDNFTRRGNGRHENGVKIDEELYDPSVHMP